MIVAVIAVAMMAGIAQHALDCGPIPMPPHGIYQVMDDPDVQWVSSWDVDRTCRQDGGVEIGRYLACEAARVMVLPNDAGGETTLCLFIHEEAHRHGWPYDHPGAVYWTGERR